MATAHQSLLGDSTAFGNLDQEILHEFGLGLPSPTSLQESPIPQIMLEPSQSEKDLNSMLNGPPLRLDPKLLPPLPNQPNSLFTHDLKFPRDSFLSASASSVGPSGPPSPALSVRSDLSSTTTLSAQSDFGFYPELASFTLSPNPMDTIHEMPTMNETDFLMETQAAMDAMF
ncbi:hypothetical protein HDU76_007737, partial [Blyttiomyces sp. JEL0837]